jgi:hypothetical protein
VAVDPEKNKAIMDWSTPKDVSDIRSFMGLAGYYRRFIKGFSKIGCPITSLQKKGVKFIWTSGCEERFQELKYLITNAPVLKIAYPNKDFLVCTDACKEGLGGVLTQEGHVICYESKKLNEHEVNYVTHDMELAAIVHALKMWRHYLLGRSFVLMTNHNGLRYLFDQPKLNVRQARWMDLLSEFDFEINDGLLTYKGRLYIPNCDDLKRFIMDEIHKRPYTSHPGYQKMITATRKLFYLPGLKKDIVDYLAKCLEFHKFKEEHRHLAGLLQPLPIPEWKWETTSMDFITGLPISTKQNDVIMVFVEKLSKDAHFILVKSTCKVIDIANIFMKEIFRLHGMPKEIISDRDSRDLFQ